MYEFECTVTRVVDGDTLVVRIDLGCDVGIRATLRLWHPDGIFDAPETRGEERDAGKRAKEYVREWVIDHGDIITSRTHRDRRGKYGRYLADIISGDGRVLTADMLATGHAVIHPEK